MRHVAVRTGLFVLVAVVGALFSFSDAAQAAKNACLCACRSDEVIVTKQPFRTPATADCAATICAAENVCGGAENVASARVDGSRCSCGCRTYDKRTEFTELSAGNTTCRNDCSETCGGAANLDGDGRVVSVACIPGKNDCSAGSFSIYKGVTCSLQTSKSPDRWTETGGKEPQCIIPVTAENAHRECAYYGGIARGGSGGTIVGSIFSGIGGYCGTLEEQNPNSFFKSRPKLGAPGKEYTGSYTVQSWESSMDAEHPNNEIKATDGICYRFGVLFGGLPSYQQEDSQTQAAAAIDDAIPEIPFLGGAVPSNKYVCLKIKQNTCGSVNPPTTHSPLLPARSYTCQNPLNVENSAKRCFPRTGSDTQGNNYADLCVTTPGTQCCQGGTVFSGCLEDEDCSVDGSKICEGEDQLKLIEGQCVVKTICDPEHTDRRCRGASPVEKVNPDFCSPESVLPMSQARCPNTSQSCCVAANAAVVTGCAADVAREAGPGSIFEEFTCFDTGSPQLDSQYFTRQDGSRVLRGIEDEYSNNLSSRPENYTGGGQYHCLTGNAPKYQGGQVVGSIPRCGQGKVCCNPAGLGAPNPRKTIGSPCGKPGMTCRSFDQMLPSTDIEAQARGFGSREEYYDSLSRSSTCQVTPFPGGGGALSNQECNPEAICCSEDIMGWGWQEGCESDQECGRGFVCDPSLAVCVDANVRKEQLESGSCFAAARATIGLTADQVSNLNPTVERDQFSCQQIAETTAPSDVRTKCLPAGAGCGNGAALCCIPGVGVPASSAAQGGKPQAVVTAPFSLNLPACIKEGNCSLDDVVRTGAQFANFLIQISGAVFLAIFVWGGFKYITPSTVKDRPAEAKKMIVQASLAMIFLLGAFVFVSFIERALITSSAGKDPGQSEACLSRTTEDGSAYRCRFLKSGTPDEQDKEISESQCVRNLCPGPENYVCCPS